MTSPALRTIVSFARLILTVMRVLSVSSEDEMVACRRPADAAARIKAGIQAFDVPNEPFVQAARAIITGERFWPLILVGERHDELVCLEGHLRLTAYALAGFPTDVECLVGTAPTMGRWAH